MPNKTPTKPKNNVWYSATITYNGTKTNTTIVKAK